MQNTQDLIDACQEYRLRYKPEERTKEAASHFSAVYDVFAEGGYVFRARDRLVYALLDVFAPFGGFAEEELSFLRDVAHLDVSPEQLQSQYETWRQDGMERSFLRGIQMETAVIRERCARLLLLACLVRPEQFKERFSSTVHVIADIESA